MIIELKLEDGVVRAYATHPDLKLMEDRVTKVNSGSVKQHP